MRILSLISLFLSGCSILDGLHQFNSGSMPAYPKYIADEPCIWREGGQTWLIDKNGVHELK